jgi:thiol-disulfide isomerase/thioredoxin
LDETEDAVVVVFKSSQCPKCRALAPYVKRVAERFSKLPGHRVLVCALDLAKFHPASLADAAVPSLLMLPAFHKSPPFRFYSGQGKVFPIMDWVRANAGHKFEFREELPQFDDEQKRLFREQIQQREVKRREAGKPPQQQQQQQQQQDQDQVREDL